MHCFVFSFTFSKQQKTVKFHHLHSVRKLQSNLKMNLFCRNTWLTLKMNRSIQFFSFSWHRSNALCSSVILRPSWCNFRLQSAVQRIVSCVAIWVTVNFAGTLHMHLKIRAIENNDHLLRQVSDVALINLSFSVPVGCKLLPQCSKSLFYFLKFILLYSIPLTEHLLEKH